MDDVFIQRLMQTSLNSAELSNSASSGSATALSMSADSDPLVTPTEDHHRFSTAFGGISAGESETKASLSLSTSSKRAPSPKADHLPDTFLTPKKAKPATAPSGLKPWSTPNLDRSAAAANTIGYRRARVISGSREYGSPGRRHTVAKPLPATFRMPASKSHSGILRLISVPDAAATRAEDAEVLHIRLPLSPARTSPRPFTNTVKARVPSRKRTRSEVREAVREKNLQIRLDDPRAKTAAVAIDGLFGVGKEESKAGRCGYAGLGIGGDKNSWKRVEDYETL